MIEFIDKTTSSAGTKMNRANMMAIQGFEAVTVVFGENSIVETNENGDTLTTTFNNDGSITETLEGQFSLTMVTEFSGNTVTTTLQEGDENE